MKGQNLGITTSDEYLKVVVSDDGSKPDILSRISRATAALIKPKKICRDNNISFGSKVKLIRSLFIFIFLYACELWNWAAESEKRTQAFDIRRYGRRLHISTRTIKPMRRYAERSKQPVENMTN